MEQVLQQDAGRLLGFGWRVVCVCVIKAQNGEKAEMMMAGIHTEGKP